MSLPRCDSQWNDFMVRRYDTYAAAKYEILLAWLGDVAGRSVIVAGCGGGELACLLARRGASVTAFDVDEATVALAREAARAAGVEVRFRVSALEDYSDETVYDVAVATDVLEHIERDAVAARRLISLVRPGGSVVVTVPAGPWLFGYHDEILGHYRRYTSASLRTLFASGVRIDRLRPYGFGLIPVVLFFSRFLRRPYPTARVGLTSTQPSLLGAVIRWFFEFEKRIVPPTGTSLLMIATVDASS